MLDASSVFGVVENSQTVTPVEQMTCDQILQNDVLEVGYFQKFDSKHGKLALIGGRDCWNEIKDAFNDADEFVRTKLSKLEEKNYDLHDMSLPTLAEYEEMTAKIPDYSDGMTLVTRWAWKDSQVPAGQEVGLCVQQGENTMGSCWSFKRNEDGSYANKNSSYLINLSMTNAETRFSDYEDIGSYATPAFSGSWLCNKVQSCPENGWSTAGCLRFLPKEELATIADVRFTSGEVKVVTYLVEPSEDSAEYESYLKTKTEEGQAELQEQTDKLMARINDYSPFREFSINLTNAAL